MDEGMTSPDETDSSKLLNPIQIHSNTFTLPKGSMIIDDEYENDLFVVIVHRSTITQYPDDILTYVTTSTNNSYGSQYMVLYHTKIPAGGDIPDNLTVKINSSSDRGGLFAFKYRGLENYDFELEDFGTDSAVNNISFNNKLIAVFGHIYSLSTRSDGKSDCIGSSVFSMSSSYYNYGVGITHDSGGLEGSRFGAVLVKKENPSIYDITLSAPRNSDPFSLIALTLHPYSETQ